MSFPKYPEYKDSGVEWFGDVPCDWRVQRLKQVVNPSRPITYGIVQAGENVPDGIPYIRPADMADESGVKTEDALLRTSQEIASAYRRSSISAGDIVCSIGPSFGKLMMVPLSLEGANLTQGTARVAVANEYVPRFIFWVLRSVESYQQWESSVGGATFRALNLGPLAETFLCVPSWAEQTQIARFLDHETARIDVLIEEQQRLIELLKEKRQAVISHAVTKGLDPTVPMKDSGVEWLGEVPAHWDVVAIKWLSPVLRGASPRPIDDPKYFDDSGEYAWVRIADVSASDGTLRETTQTLSALGASLSVKMEPGEMFLSIAGTVGKPCITQIKACIHDGFVYFPSLSIDNKFLYRIFEVGTCYGGLGKMGTQLNLNTETVGGIQIGVPPNSEIAQILEFIDRQSSVFDSLVGEAGKGVELLQERRSALISAAVTGKIDVRNW